MSESENVFIYGAGGHAKVVLDVIEKSKLYNVIFLLDDDFSLKGKDLQGYSILGGKELLKKRELLSRARKAFVAIGDNHDRMRISTLLTGKGVELITAIHPSAQIARGAKLGTNTVIAAGAVIGPDVEVGDSVIINTSATVDHDCKIGEAVHIAPGCHLCGNVSIGSQTIVGAGSTIIESVTVGCNTIIGAGSVVVQDLPSNIIAMGNPAKPIKPNYVYLTKQSYDKKKQ